MEDAYRLDVAKFLVKKALLGSLVTYGELTAQFGGINQGWGNTLSGIALRCHKARLPLLSVIVVSKDTGMPSIDAIVYEDLGLSNSTEIADEQARCFEYDWKKSKLA